MKANRKLSWSGVIASALALLSVPVSLLGQANMREDARLSLYLGTNGTNDTKGFYSACMDSSNGFAYFGATYAYKVDVRGPVPVQVGNGVSFGRQASSAAMDPSAGCAYFGCGQFIFQVLANGTGAPSAGSSLYIPSAGSTFVTSLLLDDTDPANHYLYAMTETGLTNATLYKIALNQYPAGSSIVGSASTLPNEPPLWNGVIDLSNRFAYFGTYVAINSGDIPYIVKFALGSGTNAPVRVGGLALDSTIRAVGGTALDVANGYGYCCSDDSDINFGSARVYKWALNGTNTPLAVSQVDMHPQEGYCHVAFLRPEQGLLYFGSDLSYPAKVHRFRLPPGTNAPVETGTLFLQSITNAPLPAWGTNPTNNDYWGEVFIRSMAYDPVRDFVYFGRDSADAQFGFYTNQIVKTALDRDEMMVAFPNDGANTNNTIPYVDSFEAYTNEFSLVGTNGWFGEDGAMGVVTSNTYVYAGDYPIPGPHEQVLQVNGAVTNRFAVSADTNVFVDLIVQGKYWTDPLLPTLTNTPFAFCVTTNGYLAVWNNTNAPAAGNGWTELSDTAVAPGQFLRVTVEAAYDRDVNGEFYYRVWVNGTPSASPQTWYAAADTTENYFGDVLAQGYFDLDDLMVTVPTVTISSVSRNADGSVTLLCHGLPGLAHRIWASTGLSPSSWQFISTNVAGADGSWEFTDTNTAGVPSRFYRASLP